MNNKRKLIIAAAVFAVLAIPTMAWAFTGPLSADPPAPNVGDGSLDEGSFGWMGHMHDSMWGDATGDGSYDWMNQMHDYMWNNGELPENFPADTPWMGHMHDSMWGDATGDGSYDWMNQMHDYMWNNGELPENFAGGPTGSRHPMGGGMWGDR